MTIDLHHLKQIPMPAIHSETGNLRKAFTLTELAIVIGVIGVILGSIWYYAGYANDQSRVAQSIQILSTMTDSVRSFYDGQSSITGGTGVVVPKLLGANALPTNFIRSPLTNCVNTACMDNPWGNRTSAGIDTSGTLRVCAWAYNTDTACNAGAASQFFAVEFTGLSYGPCMALLLGASNPDTVPGLVNVVVNTKYVLAQAGGSLPVASALAATLCTSATKYNNTIEFIYSIRKQGG